MDFSPVLSGTICSLLLACSPSKSVDSNVKSISYNHIFIIGNTADISARVQLEKDFSAATAARGYNVIKSIDIFPPSLVNPKPPTKEQIIDSVTATKCDALLEFKLVRKEEIKYNPGVKVNANNPWLGDLLVSSLGYVSNSDNKVKEVNKQGSFAYGNGFYIVCDLVDATTRAIIYSATSQMIEYDRLNTLGKDYLISLVAQLEAKRLLRK